MDSASGPRQLKRKAAALALACPQPDLDADADADADSIPPAPQRKTSCPLPPLKRRRSSGLSAKTAAPVAGTPAAAAAAASFSSGSGSTAPTMPMPRPTTTTPPPPIGRGLSASFSSLHQRKLRTLVAMATTQNSLLNQLLTIAKEYSDMVAAAGGPGAKIEPPTASGQWPMFDALIDEFSIGKERCLRLMAEIEGSLSSSLLVAFVYLCRSNLAVTEPNLALALVIANNWLVSWRWGGGVIFGEFS